MNTPFKDFSNVDIYKHSIELRAFQENTIISNACFSLKLLDSMHEFLNQIEPSQSYYPNAKKLTERFNALT